MCYNKLIAIRKEKKISQEEMALNLSMEQTTYSRKERGKSHFSNEEWIKIAAILQVDIETIRDTPSEILLESKKEGNDEFVSIHKEALESILKYNKLLEEENRILKTNMKNDGDKK
jgi:transcriptional regulator with XRE-family HTH domain